MNPLRLLPLFAALALVGCEAPLTHNALFTTAAKSVVRVQYVLSSGDDSLPKEITDLGGWPGDAEVTTSRKAPTGTTQLAVGYDKAGTPVIAAIEEPGSRPNVITDPDVIGGYDKKARSLTGQRPPTSAASSDSSGSSAGGPSGAPPSSDHKTAKGCPIRVGMSKAEVRRKVGVDTIGHRGTDHEVWMVSPIQASTFAESAIRSVGGGFGMFGGVATAAQDKVVKTRTYTITFSGDRVVSVDETDL